MHLQSKIVSLWDMFELKADAFVRAVARFSNLNGHLAVSLSQMELVGKKEREMIIGQLSGFAADAVTMELPVTRKAVVRWLERIADPEPIKFVELRMMLVDVENRFKDEVGATKLYAICGRDIDLLSPASVLLGEAVMTAYPSIQYDCEEAAKCLCMDRPTASVFHVMRMLEIGLKALHRYLALSEVEGAANRNWHFMLTSIKGAIAEKYLGISTEKHGLERILQSLEAVKNPWRNATMHVDQVYTETEAHYIYQFAKAFFENMAKTFDESGKPIPLAASVGERR